MKTWHRYMIASSDDARSYLSVVPAALVGVLVVLAVGFTPFGSDVTGPLAVVENGMAVFLIAWPVYALVYLAWTHIGMRALAEDELTVNARRVRESRRRPWAKYLSSGAISWAIVAGYTAIVLNIYLVTLGSGAYTLLAGILGVTNVAASWAVMVYSFALEYMRVDLGGTEGGAGDPGGGDDLVGGDNLGGDEGGGDADNDEGGVRDGSVTGGGSVAGDDGGDVGAGAGQDRQFAFDMGGERVFGDYLTFSVLSSTMTAALPGRAITRTGWKLVRTNVIIAFAFNSVVVATIVSLIISYIST